MALFHDTVLPGLNKIVVKENFDLLMEKFPVVVGKECRVRTFTTSMFSRKILKLIR